MSSFADNEGRSWKVSITGFSLGKVADDCDIDLLGVVDDESGVAKELEHPVKCVQVLWSLCESQAEVAGVNPESFGESLVGDYLPKAHKAIYLGIRDFLPDYQKKILSVVIAEAENYEKQVEEEIAKAVENGSIQKAVKEAVSQLKNSGIGGTNVAVSPDVTQTS